MASPNNSAITARRFTIRGRVQGVGFRYHVLGVARELHVHGTVRNTMSGDVEVFAQGAPAAVRQLAEELRSGPRMARVTDIEELDADPDPTCTNFTIRG